MLDPAAALVVRLGLAALFAVAVVHKLRALSAFATTVAAYALVPAGAVWMVAGIAVTAEGVVAIGLAVAAPGAALLAAAILAAYAGALAINLLRGRRDIDCGCVGVAGATGISWWLVVRNVLLGAAALMVAAPPVTRPLAWVDGVTVSGGLAAAGLLYAATDALLANRAALLRIRGAA